MVELSRFVNSVHFCASLQHCASESAFEESCNLGEYLLSKGLLDTSQSYGLEHSALAAWVLEGQWTRFKRREVKWSSNPEKRRQILTRLFHILIKSGSRTLLNANNNQHTPLILAIGWKNEVALDLLLAEPGIDLNAQSYCTAPLKHAIGWSAGMLKLLSRLPELDIAAKTRDGKSIVAYAKERQEENTGTDREVDVSAQILLATASQWYPEYCRQAFNALFQLLGPVLNPPDFIRFVYDYFCAPIQY